MPSLSAVLPRVALVLALLAPIEQLDQRVQDAVQAARRPELEGPMRTASSTRQGAVVTGGLLIIALATGPLGPATARTALLVAVPVNLAVEALKLTVNRTRPDGDRHRANSSFPSSHAANAAALALVLGLRWRRLALLFGVLAGVVGCSRVYLNRHFLSDVLCGAAIGVGLGWLMFRWLRERGWTWHPRT